MNRKQTLSKAEECVLKDRQATHGPPEDSFSLISKFWSAYTGHEIKPHEVAVMLGLLKIARIKHKPLNEDNWVDLAGYAACGAELAASQVPESFWNSFPPQSGGAIPESLKRRLEAINSPAPLPSSALYEG